MSLHHPSLISAGAVALISPDGSGTIPFDLMADYAMIVLLQPDPPGPWIRRLEESLGVRDAHRAFIDGGEQGARASIRADRLARGVDAPWTDWGSARPWNILRVSPSMERRVCDALGPKTEEHPHGAGLKVYVPMEKYRPRRDTWRSRTRPLIPGYIFAELPDDDALDLARGNHAVRDVMCSEGHPVRVPAIAIGSMILMEAWGAFDATWGAPAPVRDKRRGRRSTKSKWEKGQTVRVEEGPLAGFMAEIVSADRADRIEALVVIFGRATTTMFDEEMLSAGTA